MASRAMIIVAGGSASRFGGDKLMSEVSGRPLIAHTIQAVADTADVTVVVAREDLLERVSELDPRIETTSGGETRTASEHSGLLALRREYDLVAIHDGARPLITEELVDHLFRKAGEVGGAVPCIDLDQPLVERGTLRRVEGAVRVQTPQVFRGPELVAAYSSAARAGYQGHDTVDVVQEFSDLEVAAVAGDPANIKVTYPADLEIVRKALEGASRT